VKEKAYLPVIAGERETGKKKGQMPRDRQKRIFWLAKRRLRDTYSKRPRKKNGNPEFRGG